MDGPRGNFLMLYGGYIWGDVNEFRKTSKTSFSYQPLCIIQYILLLQNLFIWKVERTFHLKDFERLLIMLCTTT